VISVGLFSTECVISPHFFFLKNKGDDVVEPKNGDLGGNGQDIPSMKNSPHVLLRQITEEKRRGKGLRVV
jgi:hypothetical protein